jgi:phage-related protein
VIQNIIELSDGLVDFDVVIHIVNSHYLADDYSDLDLYLTVIACTCDESWVTFTLGLENPLNKRFPRHRYFRDYCNWKFKSVECGYYGETAACRRNFSACQRLNNTTRFGGFRGLGATNVRYA